MNQIISKSQKEKLIELSKKFNLSFLVLFGSRSKGDYSNDSDWDFAYFTPKKIDKINLWNELEKIFINVDLVEINGLTSIYLKREIAENSILIYEKSLGLFEEFAGNVFIEYIDNLDYLKEYEQNLKENLKI